MVHVLGMSVPRDHHRKERPSPDVTEQGHPERSCWLLMDRALLLGTSSVKALDCSIATQLQMCLPKALLERCRKPHLAPYGELIRKEDPVFLPGNIFWIIQG